MSAAAKVTLKAIQAAIKFIDAVVLVIILFFIAADCYAAWDSRQAYEWAKASHYEIYKPAAATQNYSFKELQEINPDVFGWLTVYGTHIDYPIVQSSDNVKYVNTNALGRYSLSGAIFLDTRCSKDFSDFSSILYGHHMEKQAMFGEIGLFAQKDYFDARRYGKLYYGGKEHGLEFIAFVHCDAYDTTVFRTQITGREAQKPYLNLLYKKATYTRSVRATADDRIVLLSTCSSGSTNGRDILVGRITDELYEDIFKTTEKGNGLTVDTLYGIWEWLAAWAKIAVIILPLLLLILFFMIHKRQIQRKCGYERPDKGDEQL